MLDARTPALFDTVIYFSARHMFLSALTSDCISGTFVALLECNDLSGGYGGFTFSYILSFYHTHAIEANTVLLVNRLIGNLCL